MLVFIGLKMLIADFVHIPIATSLAIVASVLAIAIIASMVKNTRQQRKDETGM